MGNWRRFVSTQFETLIWLVYDAQEGDVLIILCCLLQSDLAARLSRRVPRPPAEFERAMALTERRYHAAGYCPEMPAVEDLEPGTYYLESVDAKRRRHYTRKMP